MKERRTKAKLVSADGLTRYIDISYPPNRYIQMALRFPFVANINTDSLPIDQGILWSRREYELYTVKEYKDLTVVVYLERRSAT